MASNGGLARNLTEYEAVAGTWRYLIEHRQKVAAVTPADVDAGGQAVLHPREPERRVHHQERGDAAMTVLTRLLIAIFTAGMIASCAAPGKSSDPRAISFPQLKFEIPKSERALLPNGMVVYMLEDHELPLVNLTAYIHTGSVYEPAEKTGLASITGAVIRSGGTQEMPPEKLDAELEFMASHIESSIGADSGVISMATLAKNLDRSMALFGQVLMTPAFREDRVKLAISSAIEEIRRENDDPKAVADRELRKAIYAGHPLGRYPTIKSVKNVSRADLTAFHRRYYHPNNIVLAVSGDFKKDELLAKLNSLFSGWKKEEVSLPPVGNPVPGKAETLFVRKEVSQSVIRWENWESTRTTPTSMRSG